MAHINSKDYMRLSLKHIPTIVVIILIGAGIFFWFQEREKAAREEERAKIETELGAVERRITETKRQLEAIDSLSPEEKAKRERERDVLSATTVKIDVSIEGVSIVKEGGKKLIQNSALGYRLSLPSNLVLARSVSSDWLEFHDPKSMCGDPTCNPIIRIALVHEYGDLPLEEWLAAEEKKAGALIHSPRETITLDNLKAVRVSETIEGGFEGYYYYMTDGKKLYALRISKSDDEQYHSILETFRFDTH